jgi:hypothetical protein
LLSAEINSHITTAKELYDRLLPMYIGDIKDNLETKVVKIDNGKIIFEKGESHYDKIISTIPLNALLGIIGIEHTLASDDYNVFLIATDSFDLEGAKRCFIGDTDIPFWKVNVLSSELYQFFANGTVINPEMTFNLLTKERFRILASTEIPEAFPQGPPPEPIHEALGNIGITCVGSNAQWDYFADVSSSILRLVKMDVQL